MAWTYDETDLNTTTASGRLNAVRLLVGDTDTNDQQVKNEEITFALAQEGDDAYGAAAWITKTLAAKFSRLVDIELDGQLKESYSQLQKHYKDLSNDLDSYSKTTTGGLGWKAGGISKATMEANRLDTDRPKSLIRRDQFSYDDGSDYTGEY